jgi:hypothetical protein
MTGLIPTTTYHVRAYAINADGTFYGNEIVFLAAFTSASSTLAHDILPLLAVVSILIVISIVLLRTDGAILSMIGTDSPVFIILIVMMIIMMAVALLSPLMSTLNLLP